MTPMERFTLAKQQIMADAKAGVIDASVQSYADLSIAADHDGYGLHPFEVPEDGTDLMEDVRALHNRLDQWLLAGGLRGGSHGA